MPTLEDLFCDSSNFEELLMNVSKFSEMPLFFQQEIDNLKSKIIIIPIGHTTQIVVLAIHNEKLKNPLTRIHCQYGTPIGGFVYDLVVRFFSSKSPRNKDCPKC